METSIEDYPLAPTAKFVKLTQFLLTTPPVARAV